MFCFGRPIVHQFPTAGVTLLPPSDRSDSYNLHRIGNDGIGKFHPDGISRSAFPLPAFEPYGKGTVFAVVCPVIVYRKGLYLAEEGCLSLQGQRRARRHRTIKVQWQDRQMQTHVRNFTGWTAQIIQHEIDHCEDIII